MASASAVARLLDNVPWNKSNVRSINIDLLQLLIAAALVETRGEAYGEYLMRVFSDDQEFVEVIRGWSKEEAEHGVALGTWLTRTLPNFDFDAHVKQYLEGARLSYINSTSANSIRGSRSAELLSRCAVESATSTYYKSISDLVDDEPLKIICQRLARDEINHFGLHPVPKTPS